MLDVRSVTPDDPDARRLLADYFAELEERFGGFTPPTRDQLVADTKSGALLVAFDAAGAAVACGSLRMVDPRTAELKRMVVTREARGRGLGAALLRALEDEARKKGAQRVVLDTAAPLEEAVRLYVRAGYRRIERYNDNPYAAHWFDKDLAGG